MNIQTRMQRLLDSLVSDGREQGLQLAVYRDGKLILDICAGFADPAAGKKVDRDTLFPVFSVTKGIAATMAHQLVERGLLTYDTAIASVWPEFAAHGKSGITLRHALNHTAGMQFMPLGADYATCSDWNAMCRAIANMTPVSAPGARQVYHAVNYSWLVGEVLCRVTGKSFGQLLREQITRPLGIEDSLFVGICDCAEPRVAILDEVFEPGKEPSNEITPQQTVAGWMVPLHAWMNRPEARRACVPASSGIMNARALARHYAALLPGGVDGIELLPPARVKAATVLQLPAESAEPPKGIALGYFLGGGDSPIGPRSTAFGHSGHGGSEGFADPEKHLAVGLTKNFFSPRGATGEILRALRQELGVN